MQKRVSEKVSAAANHLEVMERATRLGRDFGLASRNVILDCSELDFCAYPYGDQCLHLSEI